jgi:hypothetical protein
MPFHEAALAPAAIENANKIPRVARKTRWFNLFM